MEIESRNLVLQPIRRIPKRKEGNHTVEKLKMDSKNEKEMEDKNLQQLVTHEFMLPGSGVEKIDSFEYYSESKKKELRGRVLKIVTDLKDHKKNFDELLSRLTFDCFAETEHERVKILKKKYFFQVLESERTRVPYWLNILEFETRNILNIVSRVRHIYKFLIEQGVDLSLSQVSPSHLNYIYSHSFEEGDATVIHDQNYKINEE